MTRTMLIGGTSSVQAMEGSHLQKRILSALCVSKVSQDICYPMCN